MGNKYRQTNKVLCYCEKCGRRKIAYSDTSCPSCGPWGIMKSVDDLKKQLFITSAPPPKLLTYVPNTVNELLRSWGIT